MKSKLGIFVIIYVSVAVLFAMVTAAPTEADADCKDRMPHLCAAELQPHYCYLELNRDLCCETCMRFRADDPDCPYGDHYAKIVRKDANGVETNYNCEGYVGFFGHYHCQQPSFRAYCCKSCKS